MKLDSLQDLYEAGLRYAYDCEQQLIKALPKMADAAITPELRNAFLEHLEQTRNHATRLEQIFSSIGRKADTKSNDVIKEIIKEGEKMIGDSSRTPVRDAALIVAGNQVEHYEMAAYGSLRNFADLLGDHQSADLLEQTLNEEKSADAKLTKIGETIVNPSAMREGVHIH